MEILKKDRPGSRRPDQGLVRGKKNRYSPAMLLAHDTRNWLTVLQMYCDLLQTSAAVDARYQDWINELVAAVGRGQALVAALLDTVQNREESAAQNIQNAAPSPLASRDTAGPTPANTTDLAAAITSRLPMLQKLAGAKIQVSLEVEPDTAKTALPEVDFERILQNLAVNAMEAMPQGGELRITLSSVYVERSAPTEQFSNMLLLRVSDTGMGISPSLLPSIFQPGVSAKQLAAKDTGVRGLGLTVVRDLTVRAGGSVRVASHGGQGACFEVELPAAQAPSGQRQIPAAMISRRHLAAQPSHRQPKDFRRDANRLRISRATSAIPTVSEIPRGSPAAKQSLRQKA